MQFACDKCNAILPQNLVCLKCGKKHGDPTRRFLDLFAWFLEKDKKESENICNN